MRNYVSLTSIYIDNDETLKLVSILSDSDIPKPGEQIVIDGIERRVIKAARVQDQQVGLIAPVFDEKVGILIHERKEEAA